MVLSAHKVVKRLRKGSADDDGLRGTAAAVEEVPFTYPRFVSFSGFCGMATT
jgi:hypothetical protein